MGVSKYVRCLTLRGSRTFNRVTDIYMLIFALVFQRWKTFSLTMMLHSLISKCCYMRRRYVKERVNVVLATESTVSRRSKVKLQHCLGTN